MKRVIYVLAAITIVAVILGTTSASGQVEPEENKVEYWCEDGNGIKYEPVDTPFIVPAPPAGTTWTLIVLKAGTTNETESYPVSGQEFSHSLHDNSHVILCWEETPSDTTTTTQETTTSTTSTPTTTVIDTTTTDPSTTTSSTTPTTTLPGSTTTLLDSSTTSVMSPSTVPPTTTTSKPVTTSLPSTPTTSPPKTLPVTGANVMVYGLIGMALLLTGGFVLALARGNQ